MAKSVGPPWVHGVRWWIWQRSAGTSQPGMMKPRSRRARARRWAVVAIRWVRPTARGCGAAKVSAVSQASANAQGSPAAVSCASGPKSGPPDPAHAADCRQDRTRRNHPRDRDLAVGSPHQDAVEQGPAIPAHPGDLPAGRLRPPDPHLRSHNCEPPCRHLRSRHLEPHRPQLANHHPGPTGRLPTTIHPERPKRIGGSHALASGMCAR